MLRRNALLATLSLISFFACVRSYNNAAPVPAPAPASESAPIAAAAKIDSAKLPALHKYGHEIGVPLLVKNYGSLTNLYSALAPKRSFSGNVDSGFEKDSYGKIKFREGSAIGAIVV